MPKTQLTIAADAAKGHVILEIAGGKASLEPAAAEAKAHELARARAELSDRVPETLSEDARIEALFDPLWRTSPHDDGAALLVRHPGLGWLGFVFPPADAKALGQSLIAMAEAHEAAGTGARPAKA